jgi:ribosomal protein L32
LVHNSLKECLSFSDSNCKNWLTGIEAVLKLYDARLANNIGSIVHIRNIDTLISDYLKRLYIEQWKGILNKNDNSSSVSQGNKLSTYRDFKEDFELERYLLNIKNKQVRSTLTQLRISAHTLKIEMGRYHKPVKIPVELRLCEKCNEVENEFHFVMKCSMYNTLRNTLFFNVEKAINTQSMSEMDKFKFLISSQDYEVNIMFSNFIHAAFAIRAETNGT